ncbi:MAG: hypothetical protein GY817_08605 [bacterium]|nr:hypothetical protein [bacterium]
MQQNEKMKKQLLNKIEKNIKAAISESLYGSLGFALKFRDGKIYSIEENTTKKFIYKK